MKHLKNLIFVLQLKVELVIGSNIFIDEKKLLHLTNEYQKNAPMMIKSLLMILLGIENVLPINWEAYSVAYHSIPPKSKLLIVEFINDHVILKERKSITQYESIVEEIFHFKKFA